MLRFFIPFLSFFRLKNPRSQLVVLCKLVQGTTELGKNVNKLKANSVKVLLPISSGRISRHLYSSFFNKPAKDE
jgi:hypothetical protein